MTSAQHFEPLLKSRKAQLETLLNRIEAELEEPQSMDPSERANGIEDNEIREGVGQAGLKELQAINAALDRVRNGTFGICASCGQPISQARLEAVPHAALCEKCIRAR